MTGIERKDRLSAPDYELVMEEVAEQLEAWEVSRIYVWGPDKYCLLYTSAHVYGEKWVFDC